MFSHNSVLEMGCVGVRVSYELKEIISGVIVA